MRRGIVLLVLIILILACSDSKYKSAENVVELNISFVDQKWDGRNVPKAGQCQNCGGQGLSPALRIRNIPKDADFLIVEFNDKSMPALSRGGGHGALRFQIGQESEFVAPSVNEQTFDLPLGIELESQHRAPVGNPGAYMAPCGCGNENKYEATVMAVKSGQSGSRLLLGKGKISLGKF